jgi:hypothetical protein
LSPRHWLRQWAKTSGDGRHIRRTAIATQKLIL